MKVSWGFLTPAILHLHIGNIGLTSWHDDEFEL